MGASHSQSRWAAEPECDDSTDDNFISQFIERARWKKEKSWRHILDIVHKQPDEPFRFLTRGRRIFDIVSICALLVLVFITTFWQTSAGIARRERLKAIWRTKHNSAPDSALMKCVKLTSRDVVLLEVIICYLITTALHIIILLISSIRTQLVFPLRKLNFKFERIDSVPVSEYTEYPECVQYQLPTKTATNVEIIKWLRVNSVSSPHLATRFLLSAQGRRFLNRMCTRLHDSLQLYDNELVRRHRRGSVSFYLITVICVTISMAAAYEDSGASDVCDFSKLLLAFLEKASFTLLAAFAIASFAGCSSYSQLIYTREKLCRLTNDEKFVISLVAANTEAPFNGFSERDSSNFSITESGQVTAFVPVSAYVRIKELGNVDVFIPLHNSLFAYRSVPNRTAC